MGGKRQPEVGLELLHPFGRPWGVGGREVVGAVVDDGPCRVDLEWV